MRVAAIQFAPKFKDRRDNVSTMALLAREAISAGAQLIVLPELATTGYSFMSFDEALLHAEEPYALAGPSLVYMKSLAEAHNVAIVWGLVTRSADRSKLYNSQVLVSPNTVVSYDKINSFGNDYLWMTEGTSSPPIINYMDKRIGLLICRDVRDKGSKGSGLEDFYEKGDADIVAFSSNFGKGAFPAGSWVNFAKDNATWLIVSNRYGLESHNDFGQGGICVIEPSGKVHCEGLQWNKPCIVYADIP